MKCVITITDLYCQMKLHVGLLAIKNNSVHDLFLFCWLSVRYNACVSIL
jgi:hypothetical protein